MGVLIYHETKDNKDNKNTLSHWRLPPGVINLEIDSKYKASKLLVWNLNAFTCTRSFKGFSWDHSESHITRDFTSLNPCLSGSSIKPYRVWFTSYDNRIIKGLNQDSYVSERNLKRLYFKYGMISYTKGSLCNAETRPSKSGIHKIYRRSRLSSFVNKTVSGLPRVGFSNRHDSKEVIDTM